MGKGLGRTDTDGRTMAAIHILLSAHEWNPYFTAISVFVARKISNQKTMESNLAPKKLENCCRQWLLEEGEEGKLGPHLHNEKRKGDRSQAQQPQPWQQSRAGRR